MLREFWHLIGGDRARILPESASTIAPPFDHIMIYLLAISFISTVGIFLALVVFAVKYRHRPGNEVARDVSVSYPLEIAWSAIPFAVMLIAFFWGAHRYIDTLTPRENAENLYVIGKQWMWKIEHESGISEINQIHVPIGRDVNLLMISQDVIHSFFIPDFRVKYDVLPGRYTRAWFRAEKPGTYYLLCTQYCGTDHARMAGTVEAMKPEDYKRWLEGQEARVRTADLPEEKGKKLFASSGCVSCHGSTDRPSSIAPSLQSRFSSGDEDYIRQSLLRPSARVASGYKDVMPTYAGRLDEEEILDLISYLTARPSLQKASFEQEAAHD